MAGGAGIIAAVLFCMRYEAGLPESNLQTGQLITGTAWEPANYVALGLAVALVLLGASEVRSSVARRRDRKKLAGKPMSGLTSAAPGAPEKT
jgi:hypothetical protein